MRAEFLFPVRSRIAPDTGNEIASGCADFTPATVCNALARRYINGHEQIRKTVRRRFDENNLGFRRHRLRPFDIQCRFLCPVTVRSQFQTTREELLEAIFAVVHAGNPNWAEKTFESFPAVDNRTRPRSQYSGQDSSQSGGGCSRPQN
jgi:hypothetical protein